MERQQTHRTARRVRSAEKKKRGGRAVTKRFSQVNLEANWSRCATFPETFVVCPHRFACARISPTFGALKCQKCGRLLIVVGERFLLFSCPPNIANLSFLSQCASFAH